MATSIVTPGVSQIDNAFDNIYQMFGGKGSTNVNTPGGGLTFGGTNFGQPASGGFGGGFGMPYNATPQPDQMMTSAWNLLGPTGAGFIQQGSNLVGTGMGVAQGGLDMSGAGFGTTMAGLETLQPSIDFYAKLLTGDPGATTAALAPGAATLSNIETGALDQATRGMPAGGARAATMAGLPQAQAAQVGNAALSLIPQAAQGLLTAGTDVANIGGTQANIGQGVANTGMNIGNLGTTLSSQGFQALVNIVQEALSKQGMNYQNSPVNQFATVATGVGNLLGGGGNLAKGLNT